MTSRLLGAAVLICLLRLRTLTASPDNGDGDKGEMRSDDRLQGTWIAVSMELMGQAMPPPMGQEMLFTFDRSKIVVHDGKRREEVTYRTVDNRRPKGIDIVAPRGKGNDETMKGIYAIEGDKLRMAFTGGGGNPTAERPTGFDGKEVMIMTFKRKK